MNKNDNVAYFDAIGKITIMSGQQFEKEVQLTVNAVFSFGQTVARPASV